jgi:hypothetical protein
MAAPSLVRRRTVGFIAAIGVAIIGASAALSAQATVSSGCAIINGVPPGTAFPGTATTPTVNFNAGDTITMIVLGNASGQFFFELPTGTQVASGPSPLIYTVPVSLTGVTFTLGSTPNSATGTVTITCGQSVPAMSTTLTVAAFGALLLVSAIAVVRRRRGSLDQTPLGA